MPVPSVPRRFGTKCAGCAQGISPSDLVRKARSKVFHLNCFTCMVCNKQLSTGEELYVIDENKFVCKDDYLSSSLKEGSLNSGAAELGGAGRGWSGRARGSPWVNREGTLSPHSSPSMFTPSSSFGALVVFSCVQEAPKVPCGFFCPPLPYQDALLVPPNWGKDYKTRFEKSPVKVQPCSPLRQEWVPG